MSSRLYEYPAWPGPTFTSERRGPASAPPEAAAYSAQLRAGGQHLRVPDGLGLLHSGFVRALRYAEEVGAMTEEQAEHWKAVGWQVMLRLAEKQTQIVAGERPVLRGLTTLGELLTQGKLRLDPLRQKGGGTTTGEAEAALTCLGGANGTLIGYHSRDYLHLLPSAAYNTVAKFARDEGRYFGMKAHMLWKAMVEEGIFDSDDAQHMATRVYVEGEYRRLLRLHRAAVEKLWGLSPTKYREYREYRKSALKQDKNPYSRYSRYFGEDTAIVLRPSEGVRAERVSAWRMPPQAMRPAVETAPGRRTCFVRPTGANSICRHHASAIQLTPARMTKAAPMRSSGAGSRNANAPTTAPMTMLNWRMAAT